MKKNNEIFKKTLSLILRTYSLIFKISPFYFLLNLLLMFLTGSVPALSLYAIKELVNMIQLFDNIGFSNVVKILLLYGIVHIFTQVIQELKSYFFSKQQYIVQNRLSLDVLNKCILLNLRDFEDSENYDSIKRAESEGISKLYAIYADSIIMLQQLVSITSIITIISSMNTCIILIILIVPIISTIINIRIGKSNYEIKLARMSNVRKASYLSFLMTNDIAFKEIKSYNVGKYLIDSYSLIKAKILNQDINVKKKQTFWDITLGFSNQVLDLIIIGWIILTAGQRRFLVGNIVAYLNGIAIIQSNISSFLKAIANVYNDTIYAPMYYDLIEMDSDDLENNFLDIGTIDNIEFNHVSFKYCESKSETLKDVNVKILKGSTIAIVGENGSGKTTFIKLLCGLYSDFIGEILIDGIDIRELKKSSLIERIGIIFQDFNQYELSLRENIGFGDISQINNDECLHKALEQVSLTEKVLEFPNGLDTQMGHWFGGEALSKGQWQRIALARALLRDADLYVMDEPTASLDPKAEKEVFSTLLNRNNNSTCIFVTHKIVNLDLTNLRILVFSEGEIVGDGAHKELVESCLVYRKLIGNIDP